jgi:hypothetical protein
MSLAQPGFPVQFSTMTASAFMLSAGKQFDAADSSAKLLPNFHVRDARCKLHQQRRSSSAAPNDYEV